MKMRHCVMVVLCSASLMVTGCKHQEEIQDVSSVKVKTMKVESVATDGDHRFSGTVEEASGSTLSFPVAGTVARIRVETGQRVTKGELIAELDEVTLLNSYDAAAALLEQAEDAYRRMETLHDAGSLPEMQWVEVCSRLKQAQSAERIAKKNLSDSRLYAPFSGVVSEKDVEAGQNVMSGTPVVRLVSVEQVKVCISVSENEIAMIQVGQPTSIRVSALCDKFFEGRIVEKGIAANKLSRSYEVKALVRNEAGDLLPGMICEMEVRQELAKEGILLPSNVIQLDNMNRQFVWVNQSGKAVKKYVTVGELGSRGVFITSGLKPGDEVLVEGQQKVSEQMDITVER